MNLKSQKIKLGVLNMTICFDTPTHSFTKRRQISESSSKTQQIHSIIPRYSNQLQKLSFFKNQTKLNPYQSYLHSKNQSIRYFREQEQVNKSTFERISGFSPVNHTIQLHINQDSKQEEENQFTSNHFIRGNHLRAEFNRKHLRIIESQMRNRGEERLGISLKANPEESLKNIFTVRSARTSQRSRPKMRKFKNKPYNITKLNNCMELKEKCMEGSERGEGQIKRIRPWSTSRNWQSKMGMFQSSMLERNEVKQQLK